MSGLFLRTDVVLNLSFLFVDHADYEERAFSQCGADPLAVAHDEIHRRHTSGTFHDGGSQRSLLHF